MTSPQASAAVAAAAAAAVMPPPIYPKSLALPLANGDGRESSPRVEYHVTAELGHGAFGRVYLAERRSSPRDHLPPPSVAVKMYWDGFLLERERTIYSYLWSLRDSGRSRLILPRLYGGGVVIAMESPPAAAQGMASSFAKEDGDEPPPSISISTSRASSSRASSSRDATGTYPSPYYIAMERLGESLSSYFSRDTNAADSTVVAWVASRLIAQLEHLHGAGIVHRDIKPENVLFHSDGQKLVLVDYGLASQFVDETGAHVAERHNIALIGTSRYCSTWAHDGVLQSRRDDLMSACFTLMSLQHADGLPWISAMDKETAAVEKASVAAREKRVFSSSTWAASAVRAAPDDRETYSSVFRVSKCLHEFYEYLSKLSYDQVPAYSEWQDKFNTL